MNFNNELVYGKNKMKNVVALEVKDASAEIFIEEGGSIKSEFLPNEYWILYSKDYTGEFIRLKNDAHYCYADKFDNEVEYKAALQEARYNRWDFYNAYNSQEMFMLKNGLTLFKGLTPKSVSILSFDIETTGLTHDKDSKVLIISNTLRKGDEVVTKLFRYDHYKSQKDLFEAWCSWVREVDPSILTGHNILGYDIPYMRYCGCSFNIGRDGSSAIIAKYTSQFRKDGSQSYDYNNVLIYGRQVVDTFFLSIKYDIGRKYPSYSLKEIIKSEGLERKDRQHYDASQIRHNYTVKAEFDKICMYAEHDADDALSLFDLMAPSYFYYTQSIPKTFQQIINGATGSQVNAFMIRSYLQSGKGVPKASDKVEYEGGISFGTPGIYKHVYKVDVASLYPSIMLQYSIYDKAKDPDGYFYNMVDYFTTERLKNKKLSRETGNPYYKDLEQAQKIFINSAYGFLGAPGLNFNSPNLAAEVTRRGRDILNKGIEWATKSGFSIINADTDSFSYSTGEKISDVMFQYDIVRLNSEFPNMINWENDGYYETFVVIKAKNYILFDGTTVTIKGSALKATMKEQALKRFIDEIIDCMVLDQKEKIYDLYNYYACSISNINADNIKKWCSKKTITKSVLNPKRTNESRIQDAIGEKKVAEGDKIFVFFEGKTTLCLAENFKGKIDADTLYKKLYKTLEIFETVLDISMFPNYALKKNKDALSRLSLMEAR